MERQFTRLDKVRELLDSIINSIGNVEDRRCAFVHLYGVGLLASVLALKRGFDRDTAELAEIAGMLHDLLCYVDPSKDGLEHAVPCADFAKANILSKLDCFSSDEIDQIYSAICHHSDKQKIDSDFDEILKDADAAHHGLRNPKEDRFFEHERVKEIIDEICDLDK